MLKEGEKLILRFIRRSINVYKYQALLKRRGRKEKEGEREGEKDEAKFVRRKRKKESLGFGLEGEKDDDDEGRRAVQAARGAHHLPGAPIAFHASFAVCGPL